MGLHSAGLPWLQVLALQIKSFGPLMLGLAQLVPTQKIGVLIYHYWQFCGLCGYVTDYWMLTDHSWCPWQWINGRHLPLSGHLLSTTLTMGQPMGAIGGDPRNCYPNLSGSVVLFVFFPPMLSPRTLTRNRLSF